MSTQNAPAAASKTDFSDRWKKKLTGPGEWKPTEQVVLKVTGYEIDKENPKNDKILGVAMTGPEEGKPISVKRAAGALPSSPDIRSFYNGKGNTPLVKSPVGAILTLERARKVAEGAYEAGWVKIVAREPDKTPVRLGVLTRIGPRMDNGQQMINAKTGLPIFTAAAVDPKAEVKVTSVAAFRETVAKMMEQDALLPGGSRGMVVSIVSPHYPSDGVLQRNVYSRGSEKVGDVYQDRDVAAATEDVVLAAGGEADIQGLLDDGATIAIMPQSYARIGGKSVEKLASDLAKGENGRSISLTEITSVHRAEDNSTTRLGTGKYGFRPMNLTFAEVTNDEGQGTGRFVLTRSANADNRFPVDLREVPSETLTKEMLAERRAIVREQAKAEEAAKKGATEAKAEGGENKAQTPTQAAPAAETHAAEQDHMDPMDPVDAGASAIDAMIAQEEARYDL